MTEASPGHDPQLIRRPKTAARPLTPPRSLGRVLGVFDALARNPSGMKLIELAQLLGAPTSSLLNLLRPMVVDGYITLEDMHYRLGPAAFRLSASIMSGRSLSDALHPFVAELARSTRESVHLGVMDPSGLSNVHDDEIDYARPMRYSAPAGCTRPRHSTAAGRVPLAFAEPHSAASYLQGLKSLNPARWTPEACRWLREWLIETRSTHFSMNLQEAAAEFGSVAAPIFGLSDDCIAAIAVSAPESELKRRLGELRGHLQSVAKRASASTGLLTRGHTEPQATAPFKGSRTD